MAKIIEYQDIPLDNLVIGKGQVRTHNPGAEIEDLAESIKVQGLLQPIVVCPARERESGKWEILTGQRRFLAHKHLGRESISTAVLDKRVSEGEAKAISITENLMRRNLQGIDLKDGILSLYNLYGSVKDVVDKTGLKRAVVQGYVKYPRLITELKKMVDDQTVDVNVALKAQDAATEGHGDPNPEVAVKLAQEMNKMSGPQRKNLAKGIKNNPDKPIDDAIEDAKTGSKVTQLNVTVTQDTNIALQQFARDQGTKKPEAAVMLIEEALTGHGLLSEE